jgi:hypothetical protein
VLQALAKLQGDRPMTIVLPGPAGDDPPFEDEVRAMLARQARTSPHAAIPPASRRASSLTVIRPARPAIAPS